MAFTSYDFTAGDYLYAAQMDNLMANWQAMGDGDADAPRVRMKAVSPSMSAIQSIYLYSIGISCTITPASGWYIYIGNNTGGDSGEAHLEIQGPPGTWTRCGYVAGMPAWHDGVNWRWVNSQDGNPGNEKLINYYKLD